MWNISPQTFGTLPGSSTPRIRGIGLNFKLNIPRKGNSPMERKELETELARLQAENQTLKESKAADLRLQVSAKGAASLYGIRRFPVTFYKEEWSTILGIADGIKAFLAEHDAELTTKSAKGSPLA